MAFDLTRTGGYSRWSKRGWEDVLTLARQNGWEPKGADCDPEWDGTCFTNEYQVRIAEDDRNLADALEGLAGGCPAGSSHTPVRMTG